MQSSISQKSEFSNLSNVRSEVARQFRRNTTNKKQMVLDHRHMKLLQDPKNIRNEQLYQPEGYSSDHLNELEGLTNYHA